MSKITAYTSLSSALSDDVLPVVDVHDTSMAATGTTKKITVGNLLAAGNDWLNVITGYGVKADVRDLTAVAITSSTSTLTCAGGSFTAADVGKVMYVYGAGAAGGPLVTTISAVTNSTTVTLAAGASTTVSSGNAFTGTDDTAAWNAALGAVQSLGQTVYLPWGHSYVSSTLSAGVTGTTIAGGGWGSQIRFSGSLVSPCIKATTASNRLFIRDIRISQVDATPAGTAVDMSNFASSSVERVSIDAGGGSGSAPAIGIDMNGASCHYNVVRDCRVNYNGAGSVGIRVQGTSHSNTVDNCRCIPGAAADSASSGIYVTNAHSTTLIHPDIESGPGNGIFLDTTAHATTIVNPYLEANNINLKISSGVQCPVVLGGTVETGTTANIQDNGAVNPVYANMWLNSGTTFSGNLATTAQIPVADTTAADIQKLGTAPVAGSNAKWADSGHVHTGYNQRSAEDCGLISWSMDPMWAAVNTTAVTGGTMYLARIVIHQAVTITNLAFYLSVAQTAPTAGQNFILLYNSAGSTLLGNTASGAIDTAIQTAGWISQAMSSTYAAAAGTYWIGVLLSKTTGSLARAGGQSFLGPNFGVSSGSSLWFATDGTTSLQSSTPPSSVASFTSTSALGISVGCS